MTRRQFLACLLMAMVALALLPLQKFCEWGERWFGKRERWYVGLDCGFGTSVTAWAHYRWSQQGYKLHWSFS